MSGGYFDYDQFKIDDIARKIQKLIDSNGLEPDASGYVEQYKHNTIEKFKRAVYLLKVAAIYAQRIDWLVCGDDSEETFHERLYEELKGIE